jgi:CHAD domain-containing protein
MAKRFDAGMRRIVERSLKRIVREGPRAVASGKDNELHALRIDVKRLRYTLEFASPIFGDELREPLALLALAQERLGALADADTFGRTYAVMLTGIATSSDLRPGLERLCNDAARERVRALEAVRALWNDPEGRSYPEKLAASISAVLGSLSNASAV